MPVYADTVRVQSTVIRSERVGRAGAETEILKSLGLLCELELLVGATRDEGHGSVKPLPTLG